MDCVAIGHAIARLAYNCWRTGRCEGLDWTNPSECHVACMSRVVLQYLRRIAQDIVNGALVHINGMVTTDLQRVWALRARWLDPHQQTKAHNRDDGLHFHPSMLTPKLNEKPKDGARRQPVFSTAPTMPSRPWRSIALVVPRRLSRFVPVPVSPSS